MQKTYNPFVQIIKSYEGFVHSEEYYTLRRQKTGSKILCAILVTLFICLFSFGFTIVSLCNDKSIADTINEIPEFSYENGILSLANRYENNTDDSYVLIDTDVSYYYNQTNKEDYVDPVDISSNIKEIGSKGNVTQAMFVSSSNIIMVNYLTGQIQQMTFSELSSILHIPAFSKSSIQSGYKGFIVKWGVILGLLWFPIRLASLFLVSLIFCLMALIGKSITKSEDDFNTIYWIAFYINIAFVIIKTIITTLLPISGSMLNMLFFALFVFVILKTLKNGDPDATQEPTVTQPMPYPEMTDNTYDHSPYDNFNN